MEFLGDVGAWLPDVVGEGGGAVLLGSITCRSRTAVYVGSLLDRCATQLLVAWSLSLACSMWPPKLRALNCEP